MHTTFTLFGLTAAAIRLARKEVALGTAGVQSSN